MRVKIFRGSDIDKLEKEINEFIENVADYIEDTKLSTDVIYDSYDKNGRPAHVSMLITFVITYSILQY